MLLWKFKVLIHLINNVSVQGKIRIEFNYMVSISPFFAGGGGGGDIQKLKAGILFQNLRGYI